MTAPPDRRLLAVLVHEVRSPVAALAALAEAWDEGLDRESRRSLAALAIAACRAVERVLADAAVTSVRLEDVDLGAIAAAVAEVARLSGARVQAVVEPGLPAVRADPVRVRQALDNLVANALAYASDEPVVVSARRGEREILLAVADSGPGIPERERARVFEPGVRLDARRPGSGLGLAVVRAIVDAHGADVRVDDTPGGGATFTLAFPLA